MQQCCKSGYTIGWKELDLQHSGELPELTFVVNWQCEKSKVLMIYNNHKVNTVIIREHQVCAARIHILHICQAMKWLFKAHLT